MAPYKELTSTISFTGTIFILATSSPVAIIGMFLANPYHAVVTTLLFISFDRLLPDFTLGSITRAAVFKAGAGFLVFALVLAPVVVDVRVVFSLVQVILLAISSSTCSI